MQDAIKECSYELFHNHLQLTDDKLKERIKDKLLRDEDSAEQLKKLKERGISFSKLWEQKIYSAVCILQFY
jgi:hypothetical protein